MCPSAKTHAGGRMGTPPFPLRDDQNSGATQTRPRGLRMAKHFSQQHANLHHRLVPEFRDVVGVETEYVAQHFGRVLAKQRRGLNPDR